MRTPNCCPAEARRAPRSPRTGPRGSPAGSRSGDDVPPARPRGVLGTGSVSIHFRTRVQPLPPGRLDPLPPPQISHCRADRCRASRMPSEPQLVSAGLRSAARAGTRRSGGPRRAHSISREHLASLRVILPAPANLESTGVPPSPPAAAGCSPSNRGPSHPNPVSPEPARPGGVPHQERPQYQLLRPSSCAISTRTCPAERAATRPAVLANRAMNTRCRGASHLAPNCDGAIRAITVRRLAVPARDPDPTCQHQDHVITSHPRRQTHIARQRPCSLHTFAAPQSCRLVPDLGLAPAWLCCAEAVLSPRGRAVGRPRFISPGRLDDACPAFSRSAPPSLRNLPPSPGPAGPPRKPDRAPRTLRLQHAPRLVATMPHAPPTLADPPLRPSASGID